MLKEILNNNNVSWYVTVQSIFILWVFVYGYFFFYYFHIFSSESRWYTQFSKLFILLFFHIVVHELKIKWQNNHICDVRYSKWNRKHRKSAAQAPKLGARSTAWLFELENVKKYSNYSFSYSTFFHSGGSQEEWGFGFLHSDIDWNHLNEQNMKLYAQYALVCLSLPSSVSHVNENCDYTNDDKCWMLNIYAHKYCSFKHHIIFILAFLTTINEATINDKKFQQICLNNK